MGVPIKQRTGLSMDASSRVAGHDHAWMDVHPGGLKTVLCGHEGGSQASNHCVPSIRPVFKKRFKNSRRAHVPNKLRASHILRHPQTRRICSLQPQTFRGPGLELSCTGRDMNSDGSNFSDDDVPSDNSRAETSRAGRSRARNASVAKNAFRVPKYHKKRKDVVEESSGEEFDFTGVDLTHTRKSSKAKGKEKEKTPEADGRVRKRRKVAHDLSFLETASVHPTAPAHPSPFAVPSADLLKCIHHFACNYYSERGQLFYTYYKDKRRAAKSAAQKKTKTNDADGQEDASEAETESTQKKKRGGDKQRGMYKTLDGSALLAIGMLLQERVARLLTPRVPDGWEEGTLDDSDEEMEVDEDGNDPGTEHQDPDDEEEDEDEGSEDNDADKAEAEYDEGNDEKDVDDEKDEDENGEGKDEDEKDEDEDEDEDGKDADEKYDDEEDTSAQGGSNPDAESENDPDDPPGKSGAPLPGDSNEEDGNEEEE